MYIYYFDYDFIGVPQIEYKKYRDSLICFLMNDERIKGNNFYKEVNSGFRFAANKCSSAKNLRGYLLEQKFAKKMRFKIISMTDGKSASHNAIDDELSQEERGFSDVDCDSSSD